MSNYTIDFEYLIPEFSACEITAETEEEAKKIAIAEMEANYPEAIDLEITKVTKID